jgi:hypothetical protein
MHPTARTTDILAQEVDGELVLYDTARHVAHRLNGSAARIWEHCDGRTPVAEIGRRIGIGSAPADEALVYAGLDALREAELLADDATFTRRSALKRLAQVAGTALVPMVVSIAAPTPADALSGSGGGGGSKKGKGDKKNQGEKKSKEKSGGKGKGN